MEREWSSEQDRSEQGSLGTVSKGGRVVGLHFAVSSQAPGCEVPDAHVSSGTGAEGTTPMRPSADI